MDKIPFSQIEGILKHKRDLRKNYYGSTHMVVDEASNTKGFGAERVTPCSVEQAGQ